MQRGRGKNIDYVWENPEKNMRNSSSFRYVTTIFEKKESSESRILCFMLAGKVMPGAEKLQG